MALPSTVLTIHFSTQKRDATIRVKIPADTSYVEAKKQITARIKARVREYVDSDLKHRKKKIGARLKRVEMEISKGTAVMSNLQERLTALKRSAQEAEEDDDDDTEEKDKQRIEEKRRNDLELLSMDKEARLKAIRHLNDESDRLNKLKQDAILLAEESYTRIERGLKIQSMAYTIDDDDIEISGSDSWVQALSDEMQVVDVEICETEEEDSDRSIHLSPIKLSKSKRKKKRRRSKSLKRHTLSPPKRNDYLSQNHIENDREIRVSRIPFEKERRRKSALRKSASKYGRLRLLSGLDPNGIVNGNGGNLREVLSDDIEENNGQNASRIDGNNYSRNRRQSGAPLRRPTDNLNESNLNLRRSSGNLNESNLNLRRSSGNLNENDLNENGDSNGLRRSSYRQSISRRDRNRRRNDHSSDSEQQRSDRSEEEYEYERRQRRRRSGRIEPPRRRLSDNYGGYNLTKMAVSAHVSLQVYLEADNKK
eukprot:99929_1